MDKVKIVKNICGTDTKNCDMYIPNGEWSINSSSKNVPLCKSETCTNRKIGVVYTEEYLKSTGEKC